MINRRKTRAVRCGDIFVGGDNDIVIQSMTNTKTSDVASTVNQILQLEKEGCQMVRVSVPDKDSAKAISKIKEKIHIPLVADIHFDYLLALESIENGIDKLRINPGNIGDDERVRQVAIKAKQYNVPIRIGVNMGSLEKNIQEKYGRTPKAMVESAMYNIRLLEKYDFNDIIVSLKASEIETMIESYESFAQISDYPLHLGVTEAGTLRGGTVKSAMGIGHLLLNGIGDTIRVSLTADPIEEIPVAKMILQNIGYKFGAVVVSCPTCARTNIDIINLANKVEEATKDIKKDIKIAVMGCIVNGPGEAKDADIGIAGGKGEALFFAKGKTLKKVKEEFIVSELLRMIDEF
ncbi:4-hydroxy-3-methylbut-2-en-1-yl diphosphate synthase [[Eubacterium] yurii subsp. margaretiae ATCC 43715]|nr:4-hydroxy-3-methylbut-2-en-1-yl diphosphate synthase [[Eubacterium] yurii subsp. margaretiae ATCC 43715]